ncbi:MAG: hypothetical protein CMJ18_19905 [Phycisphaeraceae bacterium]|nr:hypothetical protein [Phycisphaeraceae bacterium]
MTVDRPAMIQARVYCVLATGTRWPCRHEGEHDYHGSHNLFDRFPQLQDDPRYRDYGSQRDEQGRPAPGSHGGGLFPVLARTPRGTLVCVLRTGASHKNTPGAQLSLTRSSDRGRTWTRYEVVVEGDGAQDARNAAFGVLDDDRFVLAYGVHDLECGARWISVIRSDDAGRSWSDPVRVETDADEPWLHPYGQMVATGPEGLVFNSRGAYSDEQYRQNPKLPGRESYLYFSDDAGRSIARRAHVGPISETALLRLGGDRWLAYSRDHRGAAVVGTSEDGAQTWSGWSRAYPDTRFRSDFSSYIAPGSMLRLPSGRLLLVHTYRDHPFGIRAVLGTEDEGFDWSRPFALTQSFWTFDSGYPSAVCFEDGTVVVVAYTMLDLDHPEWGTCAVAYSFHEDDLTRI